MKVSLGSRSLLTALIGLGMTCMLPNTAMARVSGICSDCHTMHNSQNGVMDYTKGGTQLTQNYSVLLKGDCIGCHTGDNVSGGNIPFVMAKNAPTYAPGEGSNNTLAGGNFWWVATAGTAVDSKGHNVANLAAVDGAPGIGKTPPGSLAAWTTQLTCAGTNGCHGDRTVADQFSSIAGGHHGNDSIIDGSTPVKSFRFLKGVLGSEDDDWEFEAAVDHNWYKGAARTNDTENVTSTISSLCGQCHDKFHNGANEVDGGSWGGPWVRHPTDFDFSGIGGEYAAFDEGANYATVPVGHVTPATGQTDKIVLCISCHRAHGSPNADLLRWSYSTMDAHNGTTGNVGCFACHTTKDDA